MDKTQALIIESLTLMLQVSCTVERVFSTWTPGDTEEPNNSKDNEGQ